MEYLKHGENISFSQMMTMNATKISYKLYTTIS